jgi:hypothetical protein
MFLWSITLCFAVTLDEIPLRAIRATDPAPVVRHSLHGFTFVAKYAYGSPLSKSGVLNNHWEQDVLADQVLRRAPTNALMVDAGMNLGYYTLLARMHGLRMMSIDIQSTLLIHTHAVHGLVAQPQPPRSECVAFRPSWYQRPDTPTEL